LTQINRPAKYKVRIAVIDSTFPGSQNLQGYVTSVMVPPKCDERSVARTVTVATVMNAYCSLSAFRARLARQIFLFFFNPLRGNLSCTGTGFFALSTEISIMLQFSGIELRAVLSEALANDCRIILVKDHGVYLMSEVGETTPNGSRKVLVYAIGCNPDLDEFEQWWNVAISELGGDDFSEYLDVNDGLLTELLETGDDLIIRATDTHLYLEVLKPKTGIR